MGLPLGMPLKSYTSLRKGLKLKVRKIWGLVPIFVEVTDKKNCRGPFCPPSWIGLTLKQMLQRLPVSLAQVKAGNPSGNLLTEIR